MAEVIVPQEVETPPYVSAVGGSIAGIRLAGHPIRSRRRHLGTVIEPPLTVVTSTALNPVALGV